MSLFRPVAAAIACTLALSVSSAWAETKQELVAKVLLLQQPGIEGLGNMLAGNTSNQVLQAAGRALGSVPQDKREAVAKELQAEVRKFFDEVAPMLRDEAIKLAPATVGATYESKFSEAELKTLIAWLESPVNKKFQEVAADMQKDLGQKLIAETKPKVEPKLKQLEQKLTAKISAAAGPAPKADVKK